MLGKIDEKPKLVFICNHGHFSKDAGKRHHYSTGRDLGTPSFYPTHYWDQGRKPALYQVIEGNPTCLVLK